MGLINSIVGGVILTFFVGIGVLMLGQMSSTPGELVLIVVTGLGAVLALRLTYIAFAHVNFVWGWITAFNCLWWLIATCGLIGAACLVYKHDPAIEPLMELLMGAPFWEWVFGPLEQMTGSQELMTHLGIMAFVPGNVLLGMWNLHFLVDLAEFAKDD